MQPVLQVQGLTKHFEGFSLTDISFTLPEGYIMGLIGRNGAGKSTTLHAIAGLTSYDGGCITFCGKDPARDPLWCKSRMGIVTGAMTCYPRAKVGTLVDVTKKFYPQWDDALCARLMEEFSLDARKRVDQLSTGMQVKLSLLLALCHHPKMLLLDEPTSGLDPVSRAEFLRLLQGLIRQEGTSVLFSTHIISDLEHCADYITYLKEGRLVFSTDRETLVDSFRLVRGGASALTPEVQTALIGYQSGAFGFEGLARTEDLPRLSGLAQAPATIESIMLYHEGKEDDHESTAL